MFPLSKPSPRTKQLGTARCASKARRFCRSCSAGCGSWQSPIPIHLGRRGNSWFQLDAQDAKHWRILKVMKSESGQHLRCGTCWYDSDSAKHPLHYWRGFVPDRTLYQVNSQSVKAHNSEWRRKTKIWFVRVHGFQWCCAKHLGRLDRIGPSPKAGRPCNASF